MFDREIRWPSIVGDELGPLGRMVHDRTGHFEAPERLARKLGKLARYVGFFEVGRFWDPEQQKYS